MRGSKKGKFDIEIGPHKQAIDFLLFFCVFSSLIFLGMLILNHYKNEKFHLLIMTFFLWIIPIVFLITFIIIDLVKKKIILDFIKSKRVRLEWRYDDKEWRREQKKKINKEKYEWIAILPPSFIFFFLIEVLFEIFYLPFSSANDFKINNGIIFGLIFAILTTIAKLFSNYKNTYSDIGREVMIGDQEIYLNGEYIKSDYRKWLCDSHLIKGNPNRLVFELSDPFLGIGDFEKELSTIVPNRKLRHVKDFIERKKEGV